MRQTEVLLASLVVLGVGCPSDDGGGTGAATETDGAPTGPGGDAGGDGADETGDGGPACPPNAKEPVIPAVDCDSLAQSPGGEGQWENYDGSAVAPWDGQGPPPWEDWSEVEPCKRGDRSNDATGVLAAHAVHLPTGKVLMWEGRHDQHTWDIFDNSFEWYPLTSEGGFDDCYVFPGETDPPDPTAIDLFCAGHTLDSAGNVVAAGANLSGSSTAGSICAHVLPSSEHDGTGAVDVDDGNLCIDQGDDFVEPSTTPWSFGNFFMTPRWYPTLTTLAGGDILMTAGFIQGPMGTVGPLWFEGFDGQEWSFRGESGGIPAYPFMFVTPAGNLLYGGSEETANDSAPGRLFSQDGGVWTEIDTEDGIFSMVRGGSAVMYSPGQVMKSGGGSRRICAQEGGAPLATTAILNLDNEGTDPTSLEFVEGAQAMHRRRHFHSLTLLPDGTVLATAGNSCGNGTSGTGDNSCFADEDNLAECEEGEPACIPVISISCEVATDCPAWATCGSQSEINCPDGATCTCNPLNNACYAEREAELWDPVTQSWCLMSAQSFERMYHSTALLMPDGRVLSSGNGRRQGLTDRKTGEFFRPPYLLQGGDRPVVTSINGTARGTDFPQVDWGGDVEIVLDPDGPGFEDVGRVTLVRLGSETHQNDMNQRFVDLGCMFPGNDGSSLTVAAPADGNLAPPGHYMLFVLTESGLPSEGRYVHVGP